MHPLQCMHFLSSLNKNIGFLIHFLENPAIAQPSARHSSPCATVSKPPVQMTGYFFNRFRSRNKETTCL